MTAQSNTPQHFRHRRNPPRTTTERISRGFIVGGCSVWPLYSSQRVRAAVTSTITPDEGPETELINKVADAEAGHV